MNRSRREGTDRRGRAASRALSMIRTRSGSDTEGIAIRISSTDMAREIRGMSDTVPTTGTPWIRRPIFRRSSSMSPTSR